MKFRPCIDIHDGKVKQIVGGSLKDTKYIKDVKENYVSDMDAGAFARLYKKFNLTGGHIILLNKMGSEEYEADVRQAEFALSEYKGGFQIGGGITCDNAGRMLDLGASHVIVTSYVFKDGMIHYDRLKNISSLVGKNHLVLDLSCKRVEDDYYVVTDRWQKVTDVKLTKELIFMLSAYCDEFLVHAVDVEGKARGIEKSVAMLLGKCNDIKTTYAGGISSYEDINELCYLGYNNVDFTIGSALDIFGGTLSFNKIAEKYN